jgi:hypothetical protein
MAHLYQSAPKLAPKARLPKQLGFILQEGVSPIDGMPFVVVLTMKSTNRKTGDMAQVFILRQDVNPVEAIATGADVSICGSCPHRRRQTLNERTGAIEWVRSCYVNVGQAPLSVWRTYQRGGYSRWDAAAHARYLTGRKVRWGAYGDPAIIAPAVVAEVNALAAGHTGYTHQWRSAFAQAFVGTFQASCDGMADYLEATAHGWKTFLVAPKGVTPTVGKLCPATVSGSVAQCLTCSLCDGAKVDVWVEAHGSGAKHVATV